jgi:starch synthase
MATIANIMPEKLQNEGHDVRVFMPRFGSIKERKHRLHEVIRLSGINIPVGEDDNPLIIKVASLPTAKKQIYFLDNEDYFHKRDAFKDKEGKYFEDNDERLIFFTKGVVEILHKLGWIPDIIHLHGWMASLFPIYARTLARNQAFFNTSKFILSVYDNVIEQDFNPEFFTKSHLDSSLQKVDAIANPSCKSLYECGINYVDGIILASPSYSNNLSEAIQNSNKPTLNYMDPTQEDFAEQTYDFYNQVLETMVLHEEE